MSDLCAICLETFEENPSDCGKAKYTLPCNEKHAFHVDCIMHVFRMGDSKCPLCRDVPDNCKSEAQTIDEELALMESIARMEWKKHNTLRNRWARKDNDVKRMREKYWHARDTVNKLGREYDKEYQKSLKRSIRTLNRDFKEQRNRLKRAMKRLHKHDTEFDKLVVQKQQDQQQQAQKT